MEKRRNTLDRWQRLGFGRRTSSNTSDNKNAAKESKRSNDKTERLKELTEMLKRTRATPATAAAPPPPIPPPRKQRPFASGTPSSSCTSLHTIVKNDRMNDMESVCESIDEKFDESAGNSSFLFCTPSMPKEIAANANRSPEPNAETESHSALPIDAEPQETVDAVNSAEPLNSSTAENEDDMFMALPKVESRTIIGAYTQKNIPYRSASFSQVDYSSGKYIRSAINAFKSNLKPKTAPNVDTTSSTLPRMREPNKTGGSSMATGDTTIDSISEQIEDVEPLQFGDEAMAAYDMPSGKTQPEDIIEESDELLSTKITTVNEQISLIGLNVVQASEMILDQLCEEEAAISSSPSTDVFQTATTCLIPVPVYECVPQEWDPTSDDAASPAWINACEEEGTKFIEELNISLDRTSVKGSAAELNLDPIADTNDVQSLTIELLETSLNMENDSITVITESDEKIQPVIELDSVVAEIELFSADVKTESEIIDSEKLLEETTMCDQMENNDNDIVTECEPLPVISVTPSTAGISPADENNSNSIGHQLNVEIVEVRKRHSNDCKTEKANESASSSSEHSNDAHSNASSDDRRRIDKSKRRKGIYIQWPAIEKQKQLDADDWESSHKHTISSSDSSVVIDPLWPCDKRVEDNLEHCSEIDLTNCDFSSITTNVEKKLEKLGCGSSVAWISCKTPDGSDTPASLSGSFEPTTPESDSNRQMWPTAKASRKPSLTCQSSEEKDDVTAGLPRAAHAANQKTSLLRYESVSDNESDRTSPRERASQSPAPCDQDLKRYSKRPLRGPYGQMLEAEMKKPAKVHYDEILEELNRSDR